jgi:hypothetical protein
MFNNAPQRSERVEYPNVPILFTANVAPSRFRVVAEVLFNRACRSKPPSSTRGLLTKVIQWLDSTIPRKAEATGFGGRW